MTPCRRSTVWPVAARPNGDVLALYLRDYRVRLHGVLIHRGEDILTFHDMIGVRQRSLDFPPP